MRQLACVCVIACMAACQPHGPADVAHAAGAHAPARKVAPGNGLQVTLNDALRTERLQPSRFENKEAAPGDTFIVLDVSVHNPGRDTRVFNAGPLLVLAGGREHRFDAPENIIADGYLLLEALQPAASVRGRIVYEVPADLSGAMYWLPGNGQKLLVQAGSAAIAPASAQAAVVAQTSDARADASHAPAMPAAATPAPPAVAVASPPLRQLACRALVENNDPAERGRYQAFFRQQCAGYKTPAAWTASTAKAAPPQRATARAGVDARNPRRRPEMAGETAKEAVTTRAPEPSPQVAPSDSGPSFDCTQAVVRAEHLVCADALLSLLDRELAQAVSDAERKVPDPVALRHDQDDWRARVRDACQTLACLERVYTQRTAGLRAIGGFAEVR